VNCADASALALMKLSDWASAAATVVAPETMKPIQQVRLALEFESLAVSMISTDPDEETVAVTAGPTVARSVYDVEVVI